jgi:hypothetical protein
MLWLIWIAMIILTPLFAGIGVWRQLREESCEAPAVVPAGEADRT